MGQIHPWWDSNDISHLYRSFLNQVNWVLRGLSLATCIFNCSESCSSEGSFPCLRKNHFWVWETQAKALTCFTQSGLPYLNSRSRWSVLSIQQNFKKNPKHQLPPNVHSFRWKFVFVRTAQCSTVPWIPSRRVYMTQGSTLQQYWHEACKQNSGFSMVLCRSCLALPFIRPSCSRIPVVLIHLCHFQLTSPFRLLSGAVIPLPLIPDENVVNH